MRRSLPRFGSAPALLGTLLAVALLPQGEPRAQSAEIVAAHLGEWLVVSDDGKPGCRIHLAKDQAIGGRLATAAPECKARIPKLAEVASWRLESGVVLADATRKTLFHFEEDETTLMKTRGEAVPAYLLVQAPAGVDRAPHAPAIFGTWTMQRPGGPAICRVTFRDKPPPGGEESFALSLDPVCDAAVKRLKLASWRIEDFALMLYGTDGASLRFEPIAQGFGKAKSEGGQPLHLVRAR